MLASVFNAKRKTAKVHKKFSTIAGIRRAQSPPSPASFASPDIVDINEKRSLDATYSQDRGPSTSFDHSTTSPQIQLDLDTDSLSDWLPQSIAPTPEKRTPPRRNVSLPFKSKALPDAPSRGYGGPEVPIREEPELREPNRLFLDASIHGSLEVNEAIALSSTRKPTPSPIKIPSYFSRSKTRVQRSAEEANDVHSDDIPPPLPTKSSRPSSPSSAVTDDLSSAISGTSLARALVVNSFILSSESRASRYKSGGGRQDSATLPRGEHPLINSPYTRERRASSGSPGTPRSSSVPPVPRLPLRAELGLSMDSTGLHRRNSVGVALDSADKESFDSVPPLRRPKSTGRLRREQSMNMPPISPISEAPSPAPSTSEAPVLVGQFDSNESNRSLVNSVAPQRSLEGNASSSSLATAEGTTGHSRAATEPGTMGRPGTGNSTKPKESARKGGSLAPNAAMPGTMRSSGAFALTKGRLAVTRTMSETGAPRAGQQTRPSILLPIGERPSSVLIPVSPQPPGATLTPTSALFGPPPSTETPVDSPDLLDNFPLQIAPQRATGPPPPLPLGRRSEDSFTTTTQYSSSGESMPSTTDHRQTFPETPNAFSPLWTSTFQSPASSSSRMSMDRNSTRGRGVLEMMRMARGISGSVYSKPSPARSSRIPLTPPLSGQSGSSQPGSPMIPYADPSASPAAKRLTAIEEQVMSRAVSTYSTVPEPPTSAAPYNTTFSEEQRPIDAASFARGRDRSGSNAASHARDRSISQDHSQVFGANQNRAPTNAFTTAGSTDMSSSGMSAAEQAKAAEASSERRLRSVTNPDEPLVSPPPSYVPSFESPPHTPPAPSRSGTGDSPEPSRRSSSMSSGHLQASSSSPSSIPLKRSLSPFPSPPNSSSAPSSPSSGPGPSRSRVDAHASSISVEHPPPPYVEDLRSATPPIAVPQLLANVPPPPILGPAPPARVSTPDLHGTPNTPRSGYGTPDGTLSKRNTRLRPPLPAGPRKPSYSAAAARMRAGSVSSLGTAGPSGSHPRVMSMMSHTAPKFQTSRVPFRGLTMEAAQWTLTSQQLQNIVSTAIRQSADASAIRILPGDVLESELPQEIERLEGLSAELKLKYKLNVRKRNTLLANVSRVADNAEFGEFGAGATLGRMVEELSDVTENLDQTAEELYTSTDQLAQLVHLRDVHQRSALAMALRKLNSSFLKQVGDTQRLREQVAMLEAERDEAWREAQEVAQEFDDFTERIVADSLPTVESGRDKYKDKDKELLSLSRRSSRVMVARRTSQRASKAGLRSMYRRSQRSSTSSSFRYSGVASPGMWPGQGGGEEIPPVPPIPLRHDLSFPLSGDLPTRSSIGSPSSDLHAMVQAQKELCEMLGISVDELRNPHGGPSRRQSTSALPGVRSPIDAGPTRRNSDIVTPNHQKSFKIRMSKEI